MLGAQPGRAVAGPVGPPGRAGADVGAHRAAHARHHGGDRARSPGEADQAGVEVAVEVEEAVGVGLGVHPVEQPGGVERARRGRAASAASRTAQVSSSSRSWTTSPTDDAAGGHVQAQRQARGRRRGRRRSPRRPRAPSPSRCARRRAPRARGWPRAPRAGRSPSCSASARSPGRPAARASAGPPPARPRRARGRAGGYACRVHGRQRIWTWSGPHALRCGLTTKDLRRPVPALSAPSAVPQDPLRAAHHHGPDQRRSPMRIALFITCLADALFPDVGKATVRCWSGSATRSCSRPAQTCCGQMHVNTGYQREALPLVRHSSRPSTAVRGDRRAVRVLRRVGAPPARDGGPPGRATRRWRGGPRRSRRAPTSCPSCSSTCSASTTSARTTRTGSPTTRPATRCGCCGSATSRCGCCATVRGHRPRRAARGGPVLRLRRHVRGQERRHVDRDARRQDAQRAGDRRRGASPPATRSCLMHIGGGLARLRGHGPHRESGCHLAEILAVAGRSRDHRGRARGRDRGSPS